MQHANYHSISDFGKYALYIRIIVFTYNECYYLLACVDKYLGRLRAMKVATLALQSAKVKDSAKQIISVH